MENLLWVLVMFRILRRLLPLVIAVAGGLFVLNYIKMPMPAYMTVGLFLAVAGGLAYGIMSQFPPGGGRRSGYNHRRDDSKHRNRR